MLVDGLIGNENLVYFFFFKKGILRVDGNNRPSLHQILGHEYIAVEAVEETSKVTQSTTTEGSVVETYETTEDTPRLFNIKSL